MTTEKKREYDRKYYLKNRDKILAYQKAYREKEASLKRADMVLAMMAAASKLLNLKPRNQKENENDQ